MLSQQRVLGSDIFQKKLFEINRGMCVLCESVYLGRCWRWFDNNTNENNKIKHWSIKINLLYDDNDDECVFISCEWEKKTTKKWINLASIAMYSCFAIIIIVSSSLFSAVIFCSSPPEQFSNVIVSLRYNIIIVVYIFAPNNNRQQQQWVFIIDVITAEHTHSSDCTRRGVYVCLSLLLSPLTHFMNNHNIIAVNECSM